MTLAPLAGIAHIAKIALSDTDLSAIAALGQAQAEVWQTVLFSLLSLFAGLALVSCAELLAHLADNHVTHHLRVAATRRLSQVPLGWFTGRASGEVKQAMQDDVGTLHDLTAHFYTTMGRAIGAMVASVIYMFFMDWRMAIISILPFPLFFVIFGASMKSGEDRMNQFVTGQARINNAVVEFINGIPVVKAFGTSGKAHAGYRQAVDAFTEAFLGMTRPLLRSVAMANAVIAPTTVLGVVLAAGTAFVALGWIAPVDILPFALVAPGISASLVMIGYITHGLRNATGAAVRVQALLDTPVLDQPAAGSLKAPEQTEIRVENVSYAYDEQNPVLSDVSFILKPGTVTAIVGSSGAGKSTLARLLLRFFDPTEGRITLGGADLRHIPTPELYRKIGFVLQEVRLIHASVRDNIALGRSSATQQEIEEAARAANVHERIVSLPRGYASVIGEDAQLSGGEQQRISIARAVLLNPPILVLDEATAAADAENEVAIQETLSSFAKGRTLLVIAHRLDTVMHADRIIVIENGAIREQGDHAELLARSGRYAQLWALSGHDANQKEAAPTC
ncbi:ABC transporter ATP-binding protein [Rhizobium sp. CG5]|nr:ABC transporter ATP-binding protein [Rhizobium sp. CG5]